MALGINQASITDRDLAKVSLSSYVSVSTNILNCLEVKFIFLPEQRVLFFHNIRFNDLINNWDLIAFIN